MDPGNDISILHVDDEPDFAELTAQFLEREDERFTVETATSAGEGLDKLTTIDYDCVVSDYQMPGQNGIEFLETIRGKYPSLPFILYTGRGSEEVASEAISAGATDYLQKGSGTDQYELLANRIKNAIEQHRASRRAVNLGRIRTIRNEVNQVLIRSESRSDAETQICEIISESDPYLFAWIGEVNPESQRLEPRAWAGVEGGYLDDIMVTADNTETGHGPGGTALREGRVAVSQNVHEDLDFEPWREDALERGYQSLAAVPLEYEEQLYGALGVYSERPHAFDEDETTLLEGLGTDIASAFHSFEIQQTLHEERNFIEEALNAIKDIFYVITPDGNLSRVNKRASEVSGYSQEELLSREPTDFFTPADRERVEADIREAFDTGSASLEADFITKDGEAIPYEFRKRRLTDPEGNIIGVVGIGRDISDRKQRERKLRETLEETRKLIQAETASEAATRAVEIADQTLLFPLSGVHLEQDDNRLEPAAVTDALREHLGSPPTYKRIGSDRRVDEVVWDMYTSGETRVITNLEQEFPEIASETPSNSAIIHPLANHGVFITSATSADAFDEFDQYLAELLSAILATTLERLQQEQLIESQRDNLDLLNQMVRHDIRNDLQILLGQLDLLSEHVEVAGAEHLGIAKSSADHVIELTQTARDVTEILLQQQKDRSVVELQSALENEIEDIRSSKDQALVIVEGTIPNVEVLADDMLASVFRNLLSNAIIHNDKEVPEVTVSATTSEEVVRIQMADNGPGIPDDQKEQIFEEGETGIDSEGTGLGLYLVQTLVDRYGGRIWIEDNVPEGSVFVVELPTMN